MPRIPGIPLAPKVVLLDAGNTLFRVGRTRADLYCAEGHRFGFALSPDEVARRVAEGEAALGQVHEGCFRYCDGWFLALLHRVFDPDGFAPAAVEALARRLFGIFADPATYRLFEDSLPTLDGLRDRGIRLGIVSNWSPTLPRVLEGLGIARKVEAVLVSAIEGLEKPDPEIFRRALARIGASSSEAVHVGDDPRNDVEGARAAGIAGVLLDREGERPVAGAPCIRSLRELVDHAAAG